MKCHCGAGNCTGYFGVTLKSEENGTKKTENGSKAKNGKSKEPDDDDRLVTNAEVVHEDVCQGMGADDLMRCEREAQL